MPSATAAEAAWVDPWGTPAHPSEPPVPVMPPRPKVSLFSITLFVNLSATFLVSVIAKFHAATWCFTWPLYFPTISGAIRLH